ncbi:MAG: hypothetical protein E7Z84_05670 [Methanosphaera stadtmanae]|nr:hypothetical protein [Methanosphaera stadtmanae]
MIERLVSIIEEDGQKSFVISVLLSIFVYGGLGNAYNELFHRFGIQFIISWLVGFIAILLAYTGMSNTIIAFIFEIIVLVLYLYFIFDSFICTRAINKSQPIPKLFGKWDINEDNKSSIIAILFSFICTGLGNSYNGLHDRFLMEFIISLIIGLVLSVLVPAVNLPFLTGSYIITSILNYIQFIGNGNTITLILLVVGIILNLYFILDTYLCRKAVDSDKKIPKLFGIININ